ncbi:MAG: DUF4925 domain-containing protein [Muribaculaceae bacterium]|nr:DUF4925 domain-containing protein [Muribaculaceae bacterium]
MKAYTMALSVESGAFRAIRSIWIAAMGAGLLISLCSCKDDTEALPELKAQTFTSTNLSLTYDGEAMPGKSAKIEYKSGSASSSRTAEISLYSEFDLSQLSGMGLSGVVPAPGVIPGTPELRLTVDLIPSDGCYSFSGAGSTESVDYKFSGSLHSDLLEINFTDCSLKSQVFAGKIFAPSPIKKKNVFEYESLPFHLVWELDPTSEVDIPLSDILQAVVTAPVIPVYNNTAYTSVALMFESAVHTIALNPDGNIPVIYTSTVGGAAHLATSCGNMLQYVPSPGGVKLYVNPLSALSQMLVALSKPSEDAEFVTKANSSGGAGILEGTDPKLVTAIAKALVATLEPGLKDGIYLTVTPTASGAEIYFDTHSSIQFISALMENLIKEPEVTTALQAYLGSLDLPDVNPEELEGLIEKLPGFLEKTTRLEIGLSLVNYQPK